MLVYYSNQLMPVVQRAISQRFRCRPGELNICVPYMVRRGGRWELIVEFDADGGHHLMRVRVSPSTGKLQGARPFTEVEEGAAKTGHTGPGQLVLE